MVKWLNSFKLNVRIVFENLCGNPPKAMNTLYSQALTKLRLTESVHVLMMEHIVVYWNIKRTIIMNCTICI